MFGNNNKTVQAQLKAGKLPRVVALLEVQCRGNPKQNSPKPLEAQNPEMPFEYCHLRCKTCLESPRVS